MKVGDIDIAGEPAFILVLLEGREPRREEEAWCKKRLCLSQHIKWLFDESLGFPGGSNWKESACQCRRYKRQVQSLGQEDPLEEGMATHSSILPWRIPLTVETDRLQSMGSQSDMTEATELTHCQERVIQILLHVWLWDDSMQPTPSVYPGHFPPYMDWFLILHV